MQRFRNILVGVDLSSADHLADVELTPPAREALQSGHLAGRPHAGRSDDFFRPRRYAARENRAAGRAQPRTRRPRTRGLPKSSSGLSPKPKTRESRPGKSSPSAPPGRKSAARSSPKSTTSSSWARGTSGPNQPHPLRLDGHEALAELPLPRLAHAARPELGRPQHSRPQRLQPHLPRGPADRRQRRPARRNPPALAARPGGTNRSPRLVRPRATANCGRLHRQPAGRSQKAAARAACTHRLSHARSTACMCMSSTDRPTRRS